MMKFYNLKTRSYVEVPEADIRKVKMERETKSGKQIRYAFSAEYEGTNLFKFVNEADFNASKAKEKTA